MAGATECERAAGRYGWPQSGKIQADGVALRPAHNTIQAAPHEAACKGRRAPTTVRLVTLSERARAKQSF